MTERHKDPWAWEREQSNKAWKRAAEEQEKRKRSTPGAGGGRFPKLIKLVSIMTLVGFIGGTFLLNGLNLKATDVWQQFGPRQYFLNLLHVETATLYRVSDKSLPAYTEPLDSISLSSVKPVRTLTKGSLFVLRGYQRDGERTWVAGQLYDNKEVVPFFILIEGKWSFKIPYQSYKNNHVERFDMGEERERLKGEYQTVLQKHFSLKTIKADNSAELAAIKADTQYAEVTELFRKVTASETRRQRKPHYFVLTKDKNTVHELKKVFLHFERIWMRKAQLNPEYEERSLTHEDRVYDW